MIPILYETNETIFTSNGLGRLSDAVSCVVTEERNGIYELVMEYPVGGAHYDDLIDGRIIGATHDENGDIQPFQIYRRTRPINGIVTIYAWHISYQQNAITAAALTATGCGAALLALKTNSFGTNPFTYWTDIASFAEFTLTEPTAVRSALGGMQGSVLDTFGGEYEFDKYTVKLHASRGSVKQIAIRYGKDLVEFEEDLDCSDTYTAVVPYWKGTNSNNAEVTVSGTLVDSGQPSFDGTQRTIPLDLSDRFESVPTAVQLNTEAAAILALTEPWIPNRNITLDFVQLWKQPEYKDIVEVQSFGLCDTVTVVFPIYNVSAGFKVVRTEYDVLMDRFSEMELGKLSTTLAEAITARTQAEIKEVEAQARRIQQIADNTNQYFWFTETGSDTGAHITEIPQDEFLIDPPSGGGNLLVRSNGIAVRDGLDELARFEAAGVQIGKDTEEHTVMEGNGFYVRDAGSSNMVSIVSNNAGSSTITLGSSAGTKDVAVLDDTVSVEVNLPSPPKTGTTVSVYYGLMKSLGGTAGNLTRLDFTSGTATSGTDGLTTWTYDGFQAFTFLGTSGDSIWYITYTLASIYLPRLNVGSGVRMGQQLTSGIPNNYVRVDDGNVRIFNSEQFRRLSSVDQQEGKPSYVNSLMINGRDMFGGGKVLWRSATGYYMTDSQTAVLNEPISSQPNGIVLMWSNYTPGSGATNSGWYIYFVPKYTFDFSDNSFGFWTGQGVYISCPQNLVSNAVKNKYIYISDDSIGGHASNSASGTGYANNQLVLRAVIGI